MRGTHHKRSQGPTVVCLVEADRRQPDQLCAASLSALRAAADAACRDGRLIVAYALAPLPRTMIFSGGELAAVLDQQRRILARTEGWLRATLRAAAADVEADSRVLVGAPATELAGLAREVAADLVVVPRHWATVNPIAKLLVGSPIASLMRHAPCPVLVAPAPTPVLQQMSTKDLVAFWRLRQADDAGQRQNRSEWLDPSRDHSLS